MNKEGSRRKRQRFTESLRDMLLNLGIHNRRDWFEYIEKTNSHHAPLISLNCQGIGKRCLVFTLGGSEPADRMLLITGYQYQVAPISTWTPTPPPPPAERSVSAETSP
ncbi:uncharacterized protein Dere_GG26333 [Drosophila erecta]|uniref:Uncharacterized protein n=1 Tax=Drosophila erecta TaxID=7220 RepID=A0A0Q5WAE7_DROER|nr:uncharacterized protein Dere_GG26333 [Drosophila erecta]